MLTCHLKLNPLYVLPTFDFLYFFGNKQIFILESKRHNLPLEAAKSDIYKWLLVDRDTKSVTPLDFISMKAFEDQQERFFRQGYLSFDSDQAVFIREQSSIQDMLKPIEADAIPEWVTTSVERHLSN